MILIGEGMLILQPSLDWLEANKLAFLLIAFLSLMLCLLTLVVQVHVLGRRVARMTQASESRGQQIDRMTYALKRLVQASMKIATAGHLESGSVSEASAHAPIAQLDSKAARGEIEAILGEICSSDFSTVVGSRSTNSSDGQPVREICDTTLETSS